MQPPDVRRGTAEAAGESRSTPPLRRKGYLHLAAALTCPCHVPIFLAIFGGTALGGFVRENLLLVVLGLTGIFLLALSRGLKQWREKPPDDPPEPGREGRGSSRAST